jgi:hypothetical protein
MRRLLVVASVLLAFLPLCSGPLPQPETTVAAPVDAAASVPQVAEEIVFRGKFFVGKACRPEPDGSLALEMVIVCDVVEVLRGQLRMKFLRLMSLPEGVGDGGMATIRWRPTDSNRAAMRDAEAGGFKGMWVDGEALEVLTTEATR